MTSPNDPIELVIDADIRRARTPPGSFYASPAVLDRARERVFRPSWQLVADDDSIAGPGSVRPASLHEGLLDVPVVVARDGSGVLRVLSNVCTHRANLVVREAGRCRSLVCGYHGRRFDLDGKVRARPGFEGAPSAPEGSDDLPALPTSSLGPMVFASLDPAIAFDAWTSDLRRRMGWFSFEDARLDEGRSRDYDVAANWALYCENYLEGFHIPFVHPALAATLETSSYATELFPTSILQLAEARAGEVALEPPPGAPDHGRRIAGAYWFLFPNLMLNFYPWGISVNVVRPRGVDRCRVEYRTYVARPELLDRGAGGDLDRVEREDEAVVESVQRGLRSPCYDRGRYAPGREQGVHHFHRLLAGSLA